MATEPDRRRSLRPWLGPLISLLLIALLAAITFSLPDNQVRGGYSEAAAFIRSHLFRPQQWSRSSAVELWFVREADGLKIHDPDDESWDFMSRKLDHDAGRVLRIRYRPEIVRRGFWAMTHQTDHHRLDLEFGSAFSPEERAEAQRRFLAFAAPSLPWVPDEVFSALSRGEVINQSRILYSGYVLNVLTLLLAVAFILSLRWILLIPALVRSLRARHALACGRCPTCGYALTSLTTSICPECGRPFKLPGAPAPEARGDGTLGSLDARP